jgi:hypothetical protein
MSTAIGCMGSIRWTSKYWDLVAELVEILALFSPHKSGNDPKQTSAPALELFIIQKTAKQFDIDVPLLLQQLADEMIE